MSELKDDIAKYLNGELSPEEMHALEKRALSDPFLADALEGASQIAPEDFSSDLNSLRAELHSRRQTTLWPWVASIAAGIAAVALVTYLFILPESQPEKERIAQNNEKEIAAPPSFDDDTAQVPQVREDEAVQAEGNHAQIEPSAPTGTQPKARPREDIAAAEELSLTDAESPAAHAEEEEELATQPGYISPEAIEQPAPVAATPVESDRLERMKQSLDTRPSKTITGTVVDAEDGRAIPGVSVIVNGTTEGTITDEHGRYVISTDSLEAGLQFTFVGYETKSIETVQPGNVNVMLNPDISQLSEVVVVGYGGTPRTEDDDPLIELAEPAGGRKAYKQYLVESLRYPELALNNKVEGRVTVQFTLDPAGRMSDFRVLRGLGYGCDEEVIRLIKEGPRWRPTRRNTEAVSDKIKVRMKFALPKK